MIIFIKEFIFLRNTKIYICITLKKYPTVIISKIIFFLIILKTLKLIIFLVNILILLYFRLTVFVDIFVNNLLLDFQVHFK